MGLGGVGVGCSRAHVSTTSVSVRLLYINF